MKIYKNTFQKLGISSTSYDVYLALYQLGPSTVLQLSKKTKLPRTTLYQNLEKLLEKGLVSNIIEKNHKLFVAENIEKVEELIKQKEMIVKNQSKELEQLKSSMNEMIQSFKNIKPNIDIPSTELKYYEGEEGVRNVYKLMLNAKEIRSYPHASWMIESMSDIAYLFQEEIPRKKIIVKDIFANEQSSNGVSQILRNLSNYKYKVVNVDEFSPFEGIDYAIFDNKIAIMQGPNPPVAVVIENQFMHNHAKFIFDLLWNFLPEPK